jgi:hypothetical protein
VKNADEYKKILEEGVFRFTVLSRKLPDSAVIIKGIGIFY